MNPFQILSDYEREKLLDALRTAPDEVLIDAVRQKKDWYHNVQASFKEVQGFIGLKAVELPKPHFHTEMPKTPKSAEQSAPSEAPSIEPEVKDTKPPGIACSRVGGETKEKILARCIRPSTLEDINKFLGRGPGKLEDTKSVLKLLWERGELLYSDGVYRVKK